MNLQTSTEHCCSFPWKHKSRPPLLTSREVHLWSASLAVSADQVRFYESCLDARETRRANRYRSEQGRFRFICARGILKELLAAYCGYDPQNISFALGTMGKPYLSPMSDPPIQFNTTDTQNEALFAFCRSGEIGVDIELLPREVKHERIAYRKFSQTEYEAYIAKPMSQRKDYFLSVWTRKEAYGKAKGVGIRYTLNSVNLVCGEGLSSVSLTDSLGTEWEIRQIKPFESATACVVTQGAGWNFRCFHFVGEDSRQ